MAENARLHSDEQGNTNQKHRTRQQDSEPLLEQHHGWGQGSLSLTETPFYPQMDQHVAFLASAPPGPPLNNFVMSLQQTYGNRYVQRLVESVKVQPKLTVTAPNDIYEQEADRVSDEVMKAVNSPAQRQLAEEEEEELQAKFLLQRQELEEEELAQTKKASSIQRQDIPEEELQMEVVENQPMNVSDHLEQKINTARGSGEPLPDTVREPMGKAFGADFSGVRVHTDSEADTLNQQLSSRAFTTGQDVFFRNGEYSPVSDSGRKLIAHEMTHVVQQTGSHKPQRQPVDEEDVQMKLDIIQMVREGGQVKQEAESNLQRAHGSGQPLDEAVQRMAVVVTDDIESQTDPLVLNNLAFAEEKAPGAVGDLGKNQVWDKLTPGEAIRLVAHGKGDKAETTEGKTSNDIYHSMTTGKIKLPPPPPGGKTQPGEIFFQSCYAGALSSGASGMVSELNTLLTTAGYKVPVKGRTGIAFGFKGMGGETAITSKGKYKWSDPASESHFSAFKISNDGERAYLDAEWNVWTNKKAVTKIGVDVFVPSPPYYNQSSRLAGIDDKDKSTKWDPLTPLEKGKLVAEQMEGYWSEIHAFMADPKHGGFKTSGTGPGESLVEE